VSRFHLKEIGSGAGQFNPFVPFDVSWGPLILLIPFSMMTSADALHSLASLAASRSYAPYSRRQEGAVALLENGDTILGCRVENASFPLTITAIQNIVSTLHAIGRLDVAAIVSSHPISPVERAYLQGMVGFEWTVNDPGTTATVLDDLPDPSASIEPLVESWGPDHETGVLAARTLSEWAYCPESDFPVGAIARTDKGFHVPGVNVEHPDWPQTLCAERNALSAIIAHDLGNVIEMTLSCPEDPTGTPCGACRQVLMELAPEATVWMDRAENPAEKVTPTSLLPGAFSGSSLKK